MERKITVKAKDFNGHVRSNVKEVMSLKTNMEVRVIEFSLWKGQWFWSFEQQWTWDALKEGICYFIKEYTIQGDSKSPSHVFVWSIKNSGRLFDSKKSSWKTLKVIPSKQCITQHKPFVFDFKVVKAKDSRKDLTPGEMYGNYMKTV